MSFDLKTLYGLLPSLYRIRDVEMGKAMISAQAQARIAVLQQELNSLSEEDQEGQAGCDIRREIDENQRGPLKALLSVIDGQIAVLDENLEQLYDDQFIETCAEWAVPYIGDLIGTRGLLSITDAPFSQRPVVANTISYRRRKGTASVVEQLARDVTQWNANVVEYFKLLATTQYMNHLRPDNLSMADLRDWRSLTYLNTPFDKVAHTADVRRVESKRGKYNIPNLGIFLWRIGACPLSLAMPYQVDALRYTFDALGKDTPLYNLPKPVGTVTHLSDPINVPMPIPRRILKKDKDTYYGDALSLCVYVGGSPVDADDVSICDLGDETDAGGHVTGWYNMPKHRVAIDPVRGRLAFPSSQPAPANVQVSYYYGFTANMGGGQYSRADTFTTGLLPVIRVPSDKPTIQAALNELKNLSTGGVVEVEGNDYFIETPEVSVPAGATVELRAADECRPVLVMSGAMEVTGGANAAFKLNGLLISGGFLHVPLTDDHHRSNLLQSVNIRHCTLVPGPTAAIDKVGARPSVPRLVVETPDITINVNQSILGRIRAVDGATVNISNSIVDSVKDTEIAFADLSGQQPGASLNANNSTIIGKVYTMILNASDCIFVGRLTDNDTWPVPVMAERLQQGCARFSYFPPGSRIPKPYHCQPATAATAVTNQPAFTSLTYGDAGYCQLSQICPATISQGADDGAEMGAFHSLYQPQRIANLQARLDEYLRFSVEAGIFFGS
jgi:hypothetical protein